MAGSRLFRDWARRQASQVPALLREVPCNEVCLYILYNMQKKSGSSGARLHSFR